MTHKEITRTLAEEINASYHRTMTLVEGTRAKADESIKEAMLCGTMLCEAKEQCGHGRWLAWLREHCPRITERTAQKWMRLANTNHGSYLDNAAGLRQAYILAGIIDEGESHTGTSEAASKEQVERLALPIGRVRAWFDVRMQRAPIQDWTDDERAATKAQLEPLMELYRQL